MASLMSLAGGLVGGLFDSMKSPPPKETPETGESGIKVCVRIRPILRDEKEDSYAWNWEEKTLYPHAANQLPYTFDHLFFPENNNEDIFNQVVKNVVLQSMNGYNGSIFTYGQTSSGKTFTMNGSHSQPGIIPQSIFYCFKSIQDSFPEREFLFRVSYIEVYNEQVKDLLNSEPTNIKIQHDPKLGTILSGVKEQVVLSPQQVIALIRAGEAQRHIGQTDMNESSSRAHTLFKLIIESRQRGDSTDSPVRASFLNLIDLAGSENAKMTNCSGERAREAKHINQSLLTLSLIIFRLSEDKGGTGKKAYFPYRDSKLTRLLQSSLSGNAKIAVICTVSPTSRCVDETHNTLRFATRAKKIKTNATVSEVMDDKTLLKAYKMEINSLKARLSAMESNQVANPPFLQLMNLGDGAGRVSPPEDQDDNEVESEGLILQMISEMERLILKADVVAAEVPGKAKTLTRKKSTLGPNGTSQVPIGAKKDPPTPRVSISNNNVRRQSVKGSAPPSAKSPNLSKKSEPEAPVSSSIATVWRDNAGVDIIPEPADRDSETTKEICSDATSVDDFFDGATITSERAEDTTRGPLERGTSFIHNMYIKRPEILADISESEYINAIDPPTSIAGPGPDDCKSVHPVAKEYLKAISTVNTPSRNSQRIVPSPSNDASKILTSPSRGGWDTSSSNHSARRNSSSSTSVKTAKFGFVPSPSLTRSLSKVAKDVERSVNNQSSGSRRSSANNSAAASRDRTEGEFDTPDAALESHHRRSTIQIDPRQDVPAEAPHHVLFGVSQMLSLLKKHVEKSSQKRRSPATQADDSNALSTSTSLRSMAHLGEDGSPRNSPRNSPRQLGSKSKEEQLTSQESNEVRSPQTFTSTTGSVDDELSRRLFGNDERAYLLEEIEKKDNMLSMLTEGLREVEITQDEWLAENEMLSKELELALEQNQELNEDIAELKRALLIRERQLVFISGVLPDYEDF